MSIRSLVAAPLRWSAIAAGQTSVALKPYEVEDAYQIYSLLLPHEESYSYAKGELIIQQDTEQKHEALSSCLTVEAANKFKDAISDLTIWRTRVGFCRGSLKLQNRTIWSAQLRLAKSFDNCPVVGIVPNKRYPDSGGYFIVSLVGFNKNKTQAIVYTGSTCASLCGRWGFHLLEKVQGKWKEESGVTASLVS
jgi:hypothetical protein